MSRLPSDVARAEGNVVSAPALATLLDEIYAGAWAASEARLPAHRLAFRADWAALLARYAYARARGGDISDVG